MERRALFFSALLLAASGAGGQADTQAADRAAIDRVLNAFVAAWNAHDAKAFSQAFAEDAECTNVAGLSAVGRKAIEDFHASRFATHFKDSRQTITRSKVKFVRPDVAAVDAWWEMTGARTAAGEETGLRKGMLSFVMVRAGGEWQIAVMHNLNLPVQPSQ